MLSKEDYKNYLDQIVKIEKRMSAVYKDCSERLEVDSIRNVCRGLSLAEQRHALLVKELINLFNF